MTGGPSDDVSAQLNQWVTLTDGRQVQARNLDGLTPARGMDSIYGRPGQLPLNAPVTSTPNTRHADLYRAVIHQFAVGSNPRYTPWGGYTFCNTFAGDVMRAMGVPLPTKRECYGYNDDATIGAQALHAWLNRSDSGWRRTYPTSQSDLQTLIAHVNAGRPALASDPGHVAVIRPGQPNVGSVRDLHIAQAGASGRCRNDITLGEAGYGSVFNPSFFVRD